MTPSGQSPPPIAPPKPTPDLTPPGPVPDTPFRPRFFQVFLPWFVLWMVPLVLTGSPPIFLWDQLAGEARVAVFAAVILTAVFNTLFCIRVSSEGVKARDSWGWSRRLPWNEITRVSVVTLVLGYPCLRIESAEGKTLWAPLFLSRYDWFLTAVMMEGPRENALTRFAVDQTGKRFTSEDWQQIEARRTAVKRELDDSTRD